MRRQNPPQSHLDNATQIEGFLRPITIIFAYAILAAICLALIALTFVMLFHESILAPAHDILLSFIVIGAIPPTLALLFCFLRPRDPISLWLRGIVKGWRKPLELSAEEYTFKVMLGDGDGLCIKLLLYSPVKSQNPEMKQRLYLYANSSIARDCSLRITMPSFQHIEEAMEPALEIIATEWNIPVLYPVVRDIQKVQPDYNFQEGDLESAEFWRTGT